MYEVQDALENQKARFAKEEEQFRKKEEQLRAKDLHLQHQLFKFNKFLQDNEAKKVRADTRATEEGVQIKLREEEIKDLELELEKSRLECAELDDDVTRNQKYELFLERVKSTTDDYAEIQDLVARHDTLESANKDLSDIQTESEAKAEELRKKFQDYRKEQENLVLSLTNSIATLTADLDEKHKERQHLEHLVDDAAQEGSRHSLHFGQILMSVDNLFIRCTTKRAGIQHCLTVKDEEGTKGREGEEGQGSGSDSFFQKKEHAMWQLKVLLAYVNDLKDISEKIKDLMKKDGPKQRQVAPPETSFPMEFKIEADNPRGGDRGSQNSGSQSNTRELSRAQPSANISATLVDS